MKWSHKDLSSGWNNVLSLLLCLEKDGYGEYIKLFEK